MQRGDLSSKQAEVVVVGAGLAGLAAARALRSRAAAMVEAGAIRVNARAISAPAMTA